MGDQRPAAIASVTLNPALDQAMSIDQVALGALNRCRLDALDPGGKGLNASRVIARLGRATIALGFIGGTTGALIRARLDTEEVPHDFDEVAGDTRINIMLYEWVSGRRTRLYPPGPVVDADRLDSLLERVARIAAGRIAILAGSVPPGVSHLVYRDLVLRLRSQGVRTLVDASGAALESALDASPELIKPNVEEAGEILRRALRGDSEVLRAAEELRARGPRCVVISQGADGAIGVDDSGAWKAIPPKVEVRSTVGSGDSMTAGLAIALNEERGLAEGLRLGTAAGAATAAVPGTQLGAAEHIERLLPEVVIRELTHSGPPSPERHTVRP
ncbi:MAG: 1-phosphofructokinase [Chloroflexota bacterium]